MKTKRYYKIFILILFCLSCKYSFCQSISEDSIAKEAIPVAGITYSDTSQMDFSFLNVIVKNKRVIILGEASHGDGTTYQIKIKIIKYLAQKFNFHSVALEGSNLYDSYLLSHALGPNREADSLIKKYGMRAIWLGTWSNTTDVLPLDSLFLNGQLNCVGMDCQPNFGGAKKTTQYFIKSIKNYIDSISLNVFNNKEWDLLDMDNKYATSPQYSLSKFGTYQDTSYFPAFRLDLLKLSNFIKSRNPALNSKGDIFIQCIKNYFAWLNEMNILNYAKIDSANSMIKSNNFRDAQMANNIEWYLSRHPDEKIIIWTANFHGCRNLKNILFRPKDSITYRIDTVLGEYLSQHFKDSLYSIAFTSSESYYTYFTLDRDITHSSLEYSLSKVFDNNYGFIDFDSLRIKIHNQAIKFKSVMLGYNLKEGSWLQAFDGMFYIRKQENAHLIMK